MEKKMFVIHATINFSGGVGTVIKNLIEFQLEAGYEVGIAYIEANEFAAREFSKQFSKKIKLFPVKRLSFKGSNLLVGIPISRIFNRIKKMYPNKNIVIHAHNPASCGLFSRNKGVPLVCTIHGINSNKSFFTNKITQLILNKMKMEKNKIIAVSEDTAKKYNRQINDNYIYTVTNGVKISHKEDLITKKNDYFTIGYASYLDDLKGWKCIFEAYMLLSKEHKKRIRLILAGDGPENEIKMLEQLITENNLESKVSYLGHVKNAGDVIIPKFDIFVLPSKNEGVPMSILEAMGHGVPVLATKVGGIPEVIINEKNGFLLERSPKAFAEKIIYLYDNKDKYNAMSMSSKKTFFEKYTNEIMGKKYEEIYMTTFSD